MDERILDEFRSKVEKIKMYFSIESRCLEIRPYEIHNLTFKYMIYVNILTKFCWKFFKIKIN